MQLLLLGYAVISAEKTVCDAVIVAPIGADSEYVAVPRRQAERGVYRRLFAAMNAGFGFHGVLRWCGKPFVVASNRKI